MSSTTPSRRALFTGAGVATAGAVGAVVASGSAAQAAPAGITLLDNPVRAYDSRVQDGKLAAGTIRNVTLPASIPASSGVIANVTVSAGERRGFITVFAGGTGRPGTSTVNYVKNVDVSNNAIVKVGTGNTLQIFTSQNAHVIIDVTGTVG